MAEQVDIWFDDDGICFVLDKHAELDLFIAISLKQEFTDRRIVQLDSEPTSLCSYFLMPAA